MSHGCCGEGGGCCSSNKQEEVSKEGKLCHVCSDAFSVDAVKEFTKDPTHMCDCCGRVSNDEGKLCSPVGLEN